MFKIYLIEANNISMCGGLKEDAQKHWNIWTAFYWYSTAYLDIICSEKSGFWLINLDFWQQLVNLTFKRIKQN